MYKPVHKLFKVISTEFAAICNVACIVFCFFVITAKLKKAEPVIHPIVCGVRFRFYHPDDTILITNNQVSLKIPNAQIREQTLLNMGNLYHIDFSDQERSIFRSFGEVGAEMAGMKNYINANNNYFNRLRGLNISSSVGRQELGDWILQSRSVTKALINTDARIVVKLDKDTQHNNWQLVSTVLQKQKVNMFRLVTDTATVTIKLKDSYNDQQQY